VAALVDVATGRTLYTRSLVAMAVEQVIPLAVPATALTVAWAQVPDRGRLTLRALTEQSVTLSFALDVPSASAVGELLDVPSGPGPLDLAAGHVALIAASRKWAVVTDRGPQLRTLIPDLEVESLP
jgi:hypothetical protein